MARYELCERIGTGAMAEIYRGIAVAGAGFQKPVAIKRILPHLSRDSRFVKLLIAEAKLLSQLKHKNIVQVYDVGLGDDGQYFLVMEFVDGLDLRVLAESLAKKREKLPTEAVLFVAESVCEALDFAHRARDTKGEPIGLVHQDVTPSNILLSCSGEVKLTDFGIAKHVDDSTGGYAHSKVGYYSPERALKERVDGRSDLFSLGVVVLEMLLGEPLFSDLSDDEALGRILDADIPHSKIASLDRELGDIVLRCLATDPADRYQSAGEFARVLREYRYARGTVVDPAALIARVVEQGQLHIAEHGRLFDAAPDMADEFTDGGGTVVRIDTAVGFSVSDVVNFESADSARESTHDDLYADEPTIAMAAEELESLLGTPARPSPVESRDSRSVAVNSVEVSFSAAAKGSRPQTAPQVLRTKRTARVASTFLPVTTDRVRPLRELSSFEIVLGRLKSKPSLSIAAAAVVLIAVVWWLA